LICSFVVFSQYCREFEDEENKKIFKAGRDVYKHFDKHGRFYPLKDITIFLESRNTETLDVIRTREFQVQVFRTRFYR